MRETFGCAVFRYALRFPTLMILVQKVNRNRDTYLAYSLLKYARDNSCSTWRIYNPQMEESISLAAQHPFVMPSPVPPSLDNDNSLRERFLEQELVRVSGENAALQFQCLQYAEWYSELYNMYVKLEHGIANLEQHKKETLMEMKALRKQFREVEQVMKLNFQDMAHIPCLSEPLEGLSNEFLGGRVPQEPACPPANESLKVLKICHDIDMAFQKVEWRVPQVSKRFAYTAGRVILSPGFDICNYKDVKLMLEPEGQETWRKSNNRRRKNSYKNNAPTEPSAYWRGSVKLKVNEAAPTFNDYFLSVGTDRKGPIRHNFEESAIKSCAGFCTHMDPVDDSLVIVLEMCTQTTFSL